MAEENNVRDLMEFFSTEEKPCKSGEFMEFWKSLTDEEKVEFKTADLS